MAKSYIEEEFSDILDTVQLTGMDFYELCYFLKPTNTQIKMILEDRLSVIKLLDHYCIEVADTGSEAECIPKLTLRFIKAICNHKLQKHNLVSKYFYDIKSHSKSYMIIQKLKTMDIDVVYD